MTQRLLDPEPALEMARRQLLDAGWHDHAGNDQFKTDAVTRIADRCSVTPRTIWRWLGGARMDERTADRVAITLGTHPLLLWPDEWLAE
jgi:hypothetical protein